MEEISQTPDQILLTIVERAVADSNLRGLVLVGSRASANFDELSDLDVQVYETHTKNHDWVQQIAPVWVKVQDSYRHGEIVVPTELIIFAGGVKVDFAFYPASAMREAIRDSPVYRILLDKDSKVTDARPAGVSAVAAVPSQAEFNRVVEEFWFEAYHVAKYLVRGELWLVKARDWATKEWLLTMLHWRGSSDATDELKRSQVSEDVWKDLHQVFAHFDGHDSWRALFATTELFRRVARETAQMLRINYADEVDRNISRFIHELSGK